MGRRFVVEIKRCVNVTERKMAYAKKPSTKFCLSFSKTNDYRQKPSGTVKSASEKNDRRRRWLCVRLGGCCCFAMAVDRLSFVSRARRHFMHRTTGGLAGEHGCGCRSQNRVRPPTVWITRDQKSRYDFILWERRSKREETHRVPQR